MYIHTCIHTYVYMYRYVYIIYIEKDAAEVRRSAAEEVL